MKTWNMRTAGLFMAGLLLCAGIGLSQSITILQPNGGESLGSGAVYPIRWNAAGTNLSFKITLWKNGTLVGVVAGAVPPGNGVRSYNWTVGRLEGGGGAPPGPGYEIKVKEKSVPVSDRSDGTFRINPAVATFQAQMAARPSPDLGVRILAEPASPCMGRTIHVRFLVRNEGAAEAGATTLRVFMGTRQVESWDVPRLQPEKEFLRSRQVKLESAGIIYWSADVDHDNSIHDNHRANNSARFDMVIRAPDLVVCALVPQHVITGVSTKPAPGIDVTVVNRGDGPAGPCHVRIYIENRETKEFSVPALDPGASHRVTRRSRWSTPGRRRFRAVADSRDEVGESREDNNVLNGEFIKVNRFGHSDAREECSEPPAVPGAGGGG